MDARVRQIPLSRGRKIFSGVPVAVEVVERPTDLYCWHYQS